MAYGVGVNAAFKVHGPGVLSLLISHEMGHVLSLYHTFADCELQMVEEKEAADSSNCEWTGDKVCDTPVDPDIQNHVDPVTCIWDQYVGVCALNLNVPVNGFNPDPKNIMSRSPISCREYITEGQGERARNGIATLPHLQSALVNPNEFDQHCYCIKNNVLINTNHTFSSDEIINGNLILQAGADVLVTGTLRFPQGYGINVERGARLKVEGGLLTVACDQHHWEGICVEGNGSLAQPHPANMPQANEAGVVILIGGATIEKAVIAVSTIRRTETWNEDYWGGLVVAQNAFFKDCYRAAAFMKYRPSIDYANKSRFTDCDIRGTGNYWPNSTGITIWATDGIQFKENKFVDIKQSGLLVYDAYAEVFHDNLFEGNRYGIQGIASAPFMGDMKIGKSSTGIHRNVFRDNYIHIYGAGLQHPGKGKYVIANNDFFNGLAGIVMDGTNNYTVRKNSFLNQPFGSVVWHAGEDLNDFECNAFQDDQVSILYAGTNNNSQFLENVFINSTNADVYLEGSQALTTIRHPQGISGHPADNCFGPETRNIITSGATTLFDYILEFGTPAFSCKKPLCNLSDMCTNPNHYNLFYSVDFNSDRCDNPDPTLSSDPQFPLKDSLFNHWFSIYQADTMNTEAHHQMVEYSSQRHQALIDQVGNYANNVQDSLAIELLLAEGTPYALRLMYGLHLNRERYSEANSVLTILSSSTDATDQDFVSVQQINLLFYQSPGTFVLDSIQEQLLSDIANKEHGDRAWARSMLTYLTGLEFYPEFIATPRSSNNGSIQNDLSLLTWKVFPNPTSDLLQLSTAQVADGDKVQIQMFDVMGRQVLTQIGSGKEIAVSTAHLNEGIYMLTIKTVSSGPEQHSIIIQR